MGEWAHTKLQKYKNISECMLNVTYGKLNNNFITLNF